MDHQFVTIQFVLQHASEDRSLRVWRSEKIADLKERLRDCLGHQSAWAPQQAHYKLRLYTEGWVELRDHIPIESLTNSGAIMSGDKMYIIIQAEFGAPWEYVQSCGQRISAICCGARPWQAREEANHNYLFYWTDAGMGAEDSDGPGDPLLAPQVLN